MTEADQLRATVVAMKAWFDHENSSPAYPPGTDRDDPGNEAIWRDWWDHGIGLCQRVQDMTDAALLNASPAPVKASRAVADGAAACDCCDGRGEVGGLLLDGGGYQTDPCPYCDGTGIQPAPPLLDPAVVAELERLSARIASVDWTFEEHVDCILFIETATEPLHERVGIAQIGFDPEQRLPAETIAKLIVTMRNNLPAILAALRQGTAPAAVTDAMVEAAGTAFAHYCGGYDSSMRAAILAALQAQRGE